MPSGVVRVTMSCGELCSRVTDRCSPKQKRIAFYVCMGTWSLFTIVRGPRLLVAAIRYSPLTQLFYLQIAASCLMAGAYRSVNLSWVDCYYGGASSSGSNVRAVVRTDCRVAMVSCPYVTPAAGIHARRCNVTLVSRFVQRMRPQGVCACVAVLLLTARSRAQYISCNDLMDNVWNNDVRTIVVLFSACIGYIGSDSGVVTRASQTAPETLVSRLSGWPSTSCGKCSSIAATLRNSLPTGKQGGQLLSSTCLRL